MKIKLDHEKSQRVSELLHTLDPLPRNELHLTDALYCPMKAYCRIVLHLLPHYTRRTAGIFITGIMFDRLVEEAFEAQKQSIKLGFSLGTPDIIVNDDFSNVYPIEAYPIEAKHTRLHIRTIKDIPRKWIEQLKLECVYCQSLKGWLLIGEIDTGLITAWELTITRDEFNMIKETHIKQQEVMHVWIREKEIGAVPRFTEECPSCFYNYENGCPKRC